jgi:hypothetical protein
MLFVFTNIFCFVCKKSWPYIFVFNLLFEILLWSILNFSHNVIYWNIKYVNNLQSWSIQYVFNLLNKWRNNEKWFVFVFFILLLYSQVGIWRPTPVILFQYKPTFGDVLRSLWLKKYLLTGNQFQDGKQILASQFLPYWQNHGTFGSVTVSSLTESRSSLGLWNIAEISPLLKTRYVHNNICIKQICWLAWVTN